MGLVHRILSLVIVAPLIVVVAGCSTGAKHGSTAQATSGEAATSLPQDRQYVRTGSQDVEVKKIEDAGKKLNELTKANGGFVEKSLAVGEDSANFKLRVPGDKLEAVMNEIAALGKEEHRRVEALDVTGDLIDLQARLKNAISLRDRLRELARQAKVIKEIVELEEQLARVQTQIDTLEGRLKDLQTNVALSQLDVTLKRQRILGPLGYVIYGAAWVGEKLFIIQ